MRLQLLWRVTVWGATALFAVRVADLYLPGFRIGGSPVTELVIGGVIAGVVVATIVTAMLVLIAPVAGLVLLGATHRIPQFDDDEIPELYERDDGTYVLDEYEMPTPAAIVPHPVAKAVGAVVIYLLYAAVVVPLSAFLAVRFCQVVGLPVEFTGGWLAYFALGLVIHAVWTCAQSLLLPDTKKSWVRPWAAAQLSLLAAVVVLWLAADVAGFVREVPATGPHPLLDVLLLAAMLRSVRFVGADRFGAVVQAPADIAALWVVIWCSGWLVHPLEFAEPWQPVLTAVAFTALTLPLRLLAPPSSGWTEVRPRAGTHTPGGAG